MGAHLFDVTANQPRLKIISLMHNKLTEIDSWPAQRAQMIRSSNINLMYNRISRFKNSLDWHYDCNSAPLFYPILDLRGNNITHVNYLFQGWNSGLYASLFSTILFSVLDLISNP